MLIIKYEPLEQIKGTLSSDRYTCIVVGVATRQGNVRDTFSRLAKYRGKLYFLSRIQEDQGVIVMYSLINKKKKNEKRNLVYFENVFIIIFFIFFLYRCIHILRISQKGKTCL